MSLPYIDIEIHCTKNKIDVKDKIVTLLKDKLNKPYTHQEILGSNGFEIIPWMVKLDSYSYKGNLHTGAIDNGNYSPFVKLHPLSDTKFISSSYEHKNRQLDYSLYVIKDKGVGKFSIDNVSANVNIGALVIRFRVYTNLLLNVVKDTRPCYKSKLGLYVRNNEDASVIKIDCVPDKTARNILDHISQGTAFRKGSNAAMVHKVYKVPCTAYTMYDRSVEEESEIWFVYTYEDPTLRTIVESNPHNYISVGLSVILDTNLDIVEVVQDTDYRIQACKEAEKMLEEERLKGNINYVLEMLVPSNESEKQLKDYLRKMSELKSAEFIGTMSPEQIKETWDDIGCLYCDYEGKTYTVTGYSRLGDMWLNTNLNIDLSVRENRTYSYDGDTPMRVSWMECSNYRTSVKF